MLLDDYLHTVASAYESAHHRPDDWDVQHCYSALKTELWAQFQILNAYVRITFSPTDPYGSSAEMFESIRRGSLSVYNRADDLPTDHPFSEVAPNGETYNSVFRAVHDGFAHYPERNSFGKLGEFKAFRAHYRLLSLNAQWALFTETVGQNAWYHFGLRAHHTPKPYAEQKATLLPHALFVASHDVARR